MEGAALLNFTLCFNSPSRVKPDDRLLFPNLVFVYVPVFILRHIQSSTRDLGPTEIRTTSRTTHKGAVK